jgi:Domain of unknown function (DUF6438)
VILQRVLRVIPIFMISSLIVIEVASARPEENPDLSSLSNADLKTVTVRLERIGCYGTCPAYTVTVHGDGRVEYDGKDHVAEKGTREGRIETDAIKALIMDFAKAKFLALPEEYMQANCSRYCTDMSTAATELSVRGVTHHVKHYYGCGGVPKALFDPESAIDKSTNVERWTGDVSKAGPFGTTCWDSKLK